MTHKPRRGYKAIGAELLSNSPACPLVPPILAPEDNNVYLAPAHKENSSIHRDFKAKEMKLGIDMFSDCRMRFGRLNNVSEVTDLLSRPLRASYQLNVLANQEERMKDLREYERGDGMAGLPGMGRKAKR